MNQVNAEGRADGGQAGDTGRGPFSRRSRGALSRPPHARGRVGRPAHKLGFSLVELLIVVSLMGIFAAIVITRFEPSIQDQLRGTAQIVAADLAYARDLAVSNGSSYKITFDARKHQYVLQHSGTNPALDTLPDTPFRSPADPANQQITDLLNLPLGGGTIELVTVQELTPSPVPVQSIEFGPLGETTQPYETVIWLAAGQDAARRFLPVQLHPVTGLAAVGELQTSPPAQVSSPP